jgi:hypothetical protein
MVNSPFLLEQAALRLFPRKASAVTEPLRIVLIGMEGFGRMRLRCSDVIRRERCARLIDVAGPSNRLDAQMRQLAA